MDKLEDIRSDIRRVDDDIIELIGERLKMSKRIGIIKTSNNESIHDIDAERATLERFKAMGDMIGMNQDAAEELCKILIEQSMAVQASTPRGTSTKKKIAVIGGHGQMGRMIQRLLRRPEHDIIVIDPAINNGMAIENASDVDVVIVSVPISSVSEIFEALDRICKKDALIFDVSSLKSPFIHVLKDLASSRNICSIHPMFGPTVRSMHGRNLIICDCGSKEAVRMTLELFNEQGADIKVIPLEDHDRYMSYVLGLSHIVNIAFFTVLERSNIPFKELLSVSSTTFDKMIDTNMSVALEDPRLYYEIQHLNISRDRMLSELSDAINAVSEAALSDTSENFSEMMLKGRRYLEE
ncbi:MAG TPA: prephenate dehydrogenase/arogenate dehydrogenase family protein [Candidatus Methanomethylophilaceae archaeon]|nr:prephenate dehydrogenase/arogenate dehydrogenase family protein [Candidatus Methanomethylophilaceae archaeon]